MDMSILLVQPLIKFCRHQGIIWIHVNIVNWTFRNRNFGEILVEILTFSFKKIRLKVSSVKWWPYWITSISQHIFPMAKFIFLSIIAMESGNYVNTLRPRQNGRRFADDTFKRIFLNENVRILIKISLKFVPKGPINNIPALVQIMAWRRPGDKPLSELMMVSLLTHICVTRPQWVNECHTPAGNHTSTKNQAMCYEI